ncbi:MAG TPA: response regulator transcription factor, partial [Candidatus Binatia bacterium]
RMRTTIVLADDHELVRESIASLLREVPNFEVVGQCANGRQLLALVENVRPDVAVVDVSMPELNGIEAARQLREISPRTRVIALSAYTDEAYIRDMIDAGVVAYIIKSGAAKDLIQAIRTASRGRVYFSQEIMGGAHQVAYGRATCESAVRPLSQREREILQLVAEGKSSKEIAAILGISETTVKTHRNNIMGKLNVRDIAGLTRQAVRLKLVRID